MHTHHSLPIRLLAAAVALIAYLPALGLALSAELQLRSQCLRLDAERSPLRRIYLRQTIQQYSATLARRRDRLHRFRNILSRV